ncbi:WD repeat-containing protein 12 [Gryganskiella cystojenkinii]|nr:WD repeat-containing protein 12 [Gryganskiella cystojenkinii]
MQGLSSSNRAGESSYLQAHKAVDSTATKSNLALLASNNKSPEISMLAIDKDTLSCSSCTYADICLIPRARICVKSQRQRSLPLMQVFNAEALDQVAVELDDTVNVHQDLISGLAVNDQGTLLVSSSIDSTVRVWDVQVPFFQENRTQEQTFKSLVERYGCPIQNRVLLTGHIGWVNAVAIESTTVVSGGSDHTVRIWDALSGSLKRVIPNLFLSRELGLGVYTVAISGSLIGCGSIIEGYQVLDLESGDLLFDLDEPISSKDHVRFESEIYQQYAARIAFTETVMVTNSKLEGVLCVWDRCDGRLLYRIQVCAAPLSRFSSSSSSLKKVQQNEQTSCVMNRMVVLDTYGTSPSNTVTVEDQTVHTFKINNSGSMLMCTLCDGRVSLFEFGSMTDRQDSNVWRVESPQSKEMQARQVQEQQPEHQQHRCESQTAWLWMRNDQYGNRLVAL